MAGEAAFALPFILVRIFRPSYLEVFQISNEELGYCYSTFGIVAIFAYIFGGYFADKFKPSYLIGTSMLLTSAGGFYLATIPSLSGLLLLYGYWGVTTILLMWAALHKATRIWGGQDNQGKAFGFLDGGRALISVLIGLSGTYIFSLFIPETADDNALELKTEGLKNIFLFCSFFVASVGVLILLLLKNGEQKASKRFGIKDFLSSFKYPQVYLLAGIVVCAYSAYRLTDLIPSYAVEIAGMTDLEAADTSIYLSVLRAIVGFSIGFLVSRSKPFKVMKWAFVLIVVLTLILISISSKDIGVTAFLISVTALGLGVYTTRVMYFAVLQNSKIPLVITGSAIGIISIIGYTPDIFFGPLTGYFLDVYDYEVGFIYTFIFVASMATVGFSLTIALTKVINRE
ncbi:MAG: MFS family permease [Arenicella sp.]|jgi:MFS family permease